MGVGMFRCVMLCMCVERQGVPKGSVAYIKQGYDTILRGQESFGKDWPGCVGLGEGLRR